MLSSLAPEGIAELEDMVRSLESRLTGLAEGLDLNALPNPKAADSGAAKRQPRFNGSTPGCAKSITTSNRHACGATMPAPS